MPDTTGAVTEQYTLPVPCAPNFESWPVDCVQGTPGSGFHPDLEIERVDCFLEKGTSSEDDGYSDFESTTIDAAAYLRERGFDTLHVCGLATDYCVKQIVLDARALCFSVYVLEDCIGAVAVSPGDGPDAVHSVIIASDSLPF